MQWINVLRFWAVLLGLMLQYIIFPPEEKSILNYIIIMIHK